MKKLNFILKNISSLREELNEGVARISLRFAAHGKPILLTLWQSNGIGVEVKCCMRDIDERREYGVLEFGECISEKNEELMIVLPHDLAVGAAVIKLVLVEDGFSCESGFLIRGALGAELIVVAGAYPYSLAVQVDGLALPFEPAFPVGVYKQIALA